MILITKYFEPVERIALFETLDIQHTESSVTAATRALEEASENAKRKGRSAKFAVRVCSEYRYTCALTGYRCLTGDGATIVDAAHIEAWAATQNDDPSNGLALSKNAHWMFDEGLWSVGDDWRIIVNQRRFEEGGPDLIKLNGYHGRHLQFDPSSKLRPALAHLRNQRMRTAGIGIRSFPC